MISEYFNGKSLNRSLNPDEAVAMGATVFAALLAGHPCDKVNILILEVVSHSLGIGSTDGELIPIVHKNTTIPTKK